MQDQPRPSPSAPDLQVPPTPGPAGLPGPAPLYLEVSPGSVLGGWVLPLPPPTLLYHTPLVHPLYTTVSTADTTGWGPLGHAHMTISGHL